MFVFVIFLFLAFQCEPLHGRVQKILFWRWKEPDAGADELDHVTPHKPEVQANAKKQREFLVKWHDMSYWHCEWVSELQVCLVSASY